MKPKLAKIILWIALILMAGAVFAVSISLDSPTRFPVDI